MIKSLRDKISVIYVALVCLIAVVGLLGFFNLLSLEMAVDNLMTDNYKSISAVSNMMESLERQDSAILLYINVDHTKGIDLFSDNSNAFLKWYNIEASNISEKGETDLVNKINTNYSNYIRLFSKLQEVKNAKGIPAAIDYYNTSMLPLFIQIKQQLKDLTALNEKAMFESKHKATENTKQALYILVAITIAAVVGGFLVSGYFVKLFLAPLQKLSESIRNVKAGNLYQQLDIHTNDETGMLAKEFNEMTMRLQSYDKSTMGTLMEEKNKSMAIVRSISNPLIVLDAHYRIVLLNDACEKFFAVAESNTAGRHILEVIRNGEVFDHISETVESGKTHREKILHVVNDDHDHYFNVVVTTVQNPESKNAAFIIVFQDVTELKELEKVKTDFVATISHEFKTPLTSIIMAASMLTEGGMGPLNQEQTETLDALKEDSERLSGLVNELLELSRIESGRAVYNMLPCPVSTVVTASLKGFVEPAGRSNIELINTVGDDLPLVEVDFDKIQWVLNNLISNALKFSKPGDSITIGAQAEGALLHLFVRDTGAGIPEEYIDRIFDRFFQVSGRDIEVRGTGLGLSVAKEIVHAHHGEISVTSQIDTGSTFTITLPVSLPKEKRFE